MIALSRTTQATMIPSASLVYDRFVAKKRDLFYTREISQKLRMRINKSLWKNCFSSREKKEKKEKKVQNR